MDWKEIAAIIAPLLGAGGAGFVFLWREIKDIDKKVDRLGDLLTNNLIAMKGEIGELKGAVGTLQSQTPTP